MLPITSAGAAQTAPCSSISPYIGRRCTRVAGHDGDHSSGPILWPSGESAPTAPAAPRVSPALERVLRLAARLLPCAAANPAIARLDRIAAELRGVRRYYIHDVETCASIDAWLELWGSR